MSWWITSIVDAEETEQEMMLQLLMKERLKLERTSAMLLEKTSRLEDELSDVYEQEGDWMERIREQAELIETQEFQIIELEETNEEVRLLHVDKIRELSETKNQLLEAESQLFFLTGTNANLQYQIEFFQSEEKQRNESNGWIASRSSSIDEEFSQELTVDATFEKEFLQRSTENGTQFVHDSTEISDSGEDLSEWKSEIESFEDISEVKRTTDEEMSTEKFTHDSVTLGLKSDQGRVNVVGAETSAGDSNQLRRVQDLAQVLHETHQVDRSTWNRLAEDEKDSSSRVLELQRQVESMESNKTKMEEAIAELLQIERALREHADNDEVPRTVASGASFRDVSSTLHDIVDRLHSSEGFVKDRIQEATANEEVMKNKLDELENFLVAKKSTGPYRELISEHSATKSERLDRLSVASEERMSSSGSTTVLCHPQSVEAEKPSRKVPSRFHEHSMRIVKLEEINSELRTELDQYKKSIQRLEDLERTEVQLREQLLEEARLKSRIAELESVEEMLRSQLEESEKNFKNQLDKLSSTEKTVAELKKVEKELRSSVQIVQGNLEKESAETDQLRNKISELELIQSELRGRLAEKERIFSSLQESKNHSELEKDKLLAQIDNLEQRSELKTQDIEEMKKKRKVEEEKFLEEKVRLDRRVAELEDECVSLKESLESTTRRMDARQKMFAEREEDMRKECETRRDQLNALMGTEEDLLDRLNEQFTKERTLRKELEDRKRDLEQCEEKVKVFEAALDEAKSEVNQEKKVLEETKTVWLEAEKRFSSKIHDLEKSSALMSAKLSVLEASKSHTEREESDLRLRVRILREDEVQHKERIATLEGSDSRLQQKVTDLDAVNCALKESLKRAHELQTPSECHIYVTDLNDIHEGRNPRGSDEQDPVIKSSMSKGSFIYHHIPSGKVHQLDKMTKVELLSKIYQLERKDVMQRTKIQELMQSLASFREAVDVAAITMEADSLVPTIRAKDLTLATTMPDWAKCELMWKMTALELKKKESYLRSQLQDAVVAFQDQEADYKKEIQELEEDLLTAKKRESRLRLRLSAFDPSHSQEPQSLVTAQRLQDAVLELESSEKKLSRRIEDLQVLEEELKEKIRNNWKSKPFAFCPDSADERNGDGYYRLMQHLIRLPELLNSTRIRYYGHLEKNYSDGLLDKLRSLERNEVDGRQRLQWKSFYSNSVLAALDSPEVVMLKLKLEELENSEKHLKQQVEELEADREQLHERCRHDKGVIHELSVKNREQQLSESSLKVKLSGIENNESELATRLKSTSSRMADMEKMIKKLRCSEDVLKAELSKKQLSEVEYKRKLDCAYEIIHNGETEASRLKLDATELSRKVQTLEDTLRKSQTTERSMSDEIKNRLVSESELKSKLTDAKERLEESEEQKKQLRKEQREMTEKVEDLESALRKFKASDAYLKEQVQVVHKSERERKSKLESVMEALSEKEMELKRRMKEFLEEKDLLKKNINKLQAQIEDMEDTALTRKQALSDAEDREVSLRKRLTTLEHMVEASHRKETELEKRKSELSDKLEKVEEENASLLQEILEQKRDKERCLERIETLNGTVTELKERVATTTDKNSVMETWLYETRGKLETSEKCWKSQMEVMEQDDRRMRQRIRELESKVKLNVRSADELRTNSKSVQVRMSQTFALSKLTSDDVVYLMQSQKEFKRAMTMLESRHPFVYKEFMSTIQPNSVHLRAPSSGRQGQGGGGSGGLAVGPGVLGDSVISWGPSPRESVTDEGIFSTAADPFDSSHSTQATHFQASATASKAGATIDESASPWSLRAAPSSTTRVSRGHRDEEKTFQNRNPLWTEIDANLGSDLDDVTMAVDFSDSTDDGLSLAARNKPPSSEVRFGSAFPNFWAPALRGVPGTRRSEDTLVPDKAEDSGDAGSEMADEENFRAPARSHGSRFSDRQNMDPSTLQRSKSLEPRTNYVRSRPLSNAAAAPQVKHFIPSIDCSSGGQQQRREVTPQRPQSSFRQAALPLEATSGLSEKRPEVTEQSSIASGKNKEEADSDETEPEIQRNIVKRRIAVFENQTRSNKK